MQSNGWHGKMYDKAEEGLVFSATFLVSWSKIIRRKEYHNCIYKSST